MNWDELSKDDLLKLTDVEALHLFTIRSPVGFIHPQRDIVSHHARLIREFGHIAVIDPYVRIDKETGARVFSFWVRSRLYDRNQTMRQMLLEWDAAVADWEATYAC